MIENTYTEKELTNATLEYFEGDLLATSTWIKKYALENNKGEYLELTPDDMHKRIASELSRIENNYPNPVPFDKIYNLFKDFKYVIPQGSPMEGIGNNFRLQSLSNCFVIDSPSDSYGGIMKTDQEQAQLMKRRGGVGFDISPIRPKGARTKNAAKTTDGISIFMERFSNTTREVAQNGRRGALLLSISIKHPEIETFIDIKKDRKKVTGANISIRIDDEFMYCVKNDSMYTLQWPVDSDNPTIKKEISAKKLWNKIIEAAWENAEPGVLYWDTALKYTPSDIYKDFGFGSKSTNPCGEIVLSPYDSCRLLALNLSSYVINPFLENAYFDYDWFAKDVIIAQRLMDDIIDLELEKIDKIIQKISTDPEDEETKRVELKLWHKVKKYAIDGRRTGLGITALGDAVAMINVKYGTNEFIEITEKIYKTLAINSERSSVILAKERGAFPIFNFELEKNHPFLQRIWDADPELYEKYKIYGRRHIATTTTAPTGTTSLMTQTTSGIEPVFLLDHTRRKKIMGDSDKKPDFVDQNGDKWEEFTVYHKGLKQWMEVTGETDIKKSPYYGATSDVIDYLKSVDAQAVAQKWIEHSISKTCNLAKEVSKEMVSDLYMRAWEKGCKGFTIYRDGSRTGVLLSNKTEAIQFPEHHAPKRPKELRADYYLATAKSIKYAVIVGLLEDKPYEVFAFENPSILENCKGKIIKVKKGEYMFDSELGKIENIHLAADKIEERALTITASMILRHGAPISHLLNIIKKIDENITSFSSVVRRTLSRYINEGGEPCPDCGQPMVMQEGCMKCVNPECGYSKCG